MAVFLLAMFLLGDDVDPPRIKPKVVRGYTAENFYCTFEDIYDCYGGILIYTSISPIPLFLRGYTKKTIPVDIGNFKVVKKGKTFTEVRPVDE